MNKNTAETNQDIGALFDQGREWGNQARGKIIAGAKATDEAVQEHPYKAMGIALGAGALIGFLLARRFRRQS